MTSDANPSRWWDPLVLSEGGLSYRIGPLSLFVHHLEGEWQVAHRHEPEDEDREGWSIDRIPAIPDDVTTVRRFSAGPDEGVLRLVPRPAARSLVARPRAPLHVLAGAESRIYVSAPVWLDLEVGSDRRRLCELPTKQLSDTWFGSSTREGEVAFALRTQARTRLDEVPRVANRAITPVRIRNRGADLLLLERMNLPVPYLSIYCCERGNLWTEAVDLLRHEDDEMANFEITAGPPEEARGAAPIGSPRLASTGSPLVRAFGKLLGPFQGEN